MCWYDALSVPDNLFFFFKVWHIALVDKLYYVLVAVVTSKGFNIRTFSAT
jgi:hypothetical protein